MSARFAALALLALLPLDTLAHTGGLDRRGCHTNAETGEHHCHVPASGDRVTTSQSGGIVDVIDGDSLKMRRLEIRLQGIDAVEKEQVCHRDNGQPWPCGEQAARALRVFIAKRAVSCVHHGTDGYGRMLGTCSVDGTNINDWLVRQGWAVAYTRYSTEYLAAQAEAEAAKRNIWSGTFMNPERWRREQN